MPVHLQRAKLQGSPQSPTYWPRGVRLSMIARIRLIITALVVCHLFLQPRLLTSQLRPSQPQANPAQSTTSSPPPQQQNSAPSTASPPASASPGSSAADDDDDLDDLLDDISAGTASIRQDPASRRKPIMARRTRKLKRSSNRNSRAATNRSWDRSPRPLTFP